GLGGGGAAAGRCQGGRHPAHRQHLADVRPSRRGPRRPDHRSVRLAIPLTPDRACWAIKPAGRDMLLTMDVGNTSTVLGLFDGDEAVEHWRIATDPVRTADEFAVILSGLLSQSSLFGEPDITGIALCCTVPSVLYEMRETCRRYYGDVPAVIVEPGVKTGVPVRYDNPKEVGSDRITNAAAAMHLYGGPAIVVDFGTSTNFDAVSQRG